jgi:hypothetical protein
MAAAPQSHPKWQLMCTLGGAREDLRLIGCIFASSQAISARIDVEAIA